jgi:phosphoglycerol transferase MdoB-like AlkP superfamily enzyme
LILAVVDLCSGTNTFFQFSDHRSPMNIATSPGLRFAKSAYHLLRARDLRAIDRRVESATRAVKFQRTTGSLRKPNYVLILVESYGLALDRTRSEILKSPFFTPGLAQRYQVEFGTTRFEGATVSAEMRELCGVSSGVRVFPADPRLAHCLPAAMKARGYHTLAIHGFNSYLFNRRDWYPMLGFDEMHFLQDLGHSSDLPHCSGPFPGICDDAIADYIGEYLVTHRNQPQFVYWLTLNSHLPIEHVQANDAALRCGSKEAPARDADVCGLMALLYRTNLAIAKAAARSDLPPTEFLLVGDHAPPFLSNWRRALFSQREVPYVHLKPRQEPARAHPLHIITATR